MGDTGMQPIFTDEQLKNMSRENLAQALKLIVNSAFEFH